MSQRVKTTKEERERIARQFSTAVTVLFDEYAVLGDGDGIGNVEFSHKAGPRGGDPSPFTRDHVKITQVWSEEENKFAHLGTKDTHWTLGIRFPKWRDRGPLTRFKTIVHEAAHLPGRYNHLTGELDAELDGVDDAHPLQFWVLFAILGERVDERRGMLRTNLYDYPVTGGPIICSAVSNARRYASGISMADEWAQEVLDAVDYSEELYRVFNHGVGLHPMRFNVAEEPDDDDREEVALEKIAENIDPYSDAELYDEFEDDIFLPDKDAHRDEPSVELPHRPRVRERQKKDGEVTEYKPESDYDEKLFALAARRIRSAVECEVTYRL